MLLAQFLDPSDNGLDVLDAVAVLTVLTLAASVLYGLWRWPLRPLWCWAASRTSLWAARWVCATVEPLIDVKLQQYTYPIQKHANGGSSLPDVAVMTRAIFDHMGLSLPETK